MKHKKVFLLTVLIFAALMLGGFSYRYYLQQAYAKAVIRFHVIANSDSVEDQALKLRVRDVIVSDMSHHFIDTNNKAAARNFINGNLDSIKQLAQQEIAREGKDYPVQVMLGDYYFPTKTYGDLRFPSGEYEAVRVVIGRGQGHNWWCVLFPPLCLKSGIDALTQSHPAKGLKVFEKKNVEFRIRSLDFLHNIW